MRPGRTSADLRRKAADTADFAAVFRAEIADISERRAGHGREPLPEAVGITPSCTHALNGLALSGGGIRAASFSLGVLQALDACGALRHLDYLSTVSGGGYIGTFLTTAMSRNEGAFPFGRTGGEPLETPETRYIRDNSRYLIANGIPSVISAIAVYLRGIVMNMLVVAPVVLAASIALVVFHAAHEQLDGWLGQSLSLPLSALVAAVFLIVWTAYAIGVSVAHIGPLDVRQRLAAIAARLILCFGVLIILEMHSALLDWLSAFDGSSLQRLKDALTTIIPIGFAALPFVKTLGTWAEKGSGGSYSALGRRVLSVVVLAGVAALVPIALWLTVMLLAHWALAPQAAPALLEWVPASDSGWQAACILYAAIALCLLATWPFLSVNSNSLHQLYRDRLSAAFLVRRRQDAPDDPVIIEPDDRGFKLSEIRTDLAPYHLINAAINVPGAKFANQRGRNADFFLFSKNYVGSEQTGFVATRSAEEVVDKLDIGTAMAISGAAAAPNMGMASIKPLSPTIALLNFRLGRWFEHPASIAHRVGSPRRRTRLWFLQSIPGPRYLFREAFFKTGLDLGRRKSREISHNDFVFLTDGGHIENLGVYELLRRRCRLIIAVDAEADPRLEAGAFAQLQRFARIDLGVRISLDWQGMRCSALDTRCGITAGRLAPKNGPHVAIGRIDYPPQTPASAAEVGVLLYVKSSLSGDESDYVIKYAREHASFPHETTADQLFSEEQLEVYRALGEHSVRRVMSGEDGASCFTSDRDELYDIVRAALPGAFIAAAGNTTGPQS